MLKKIINSNINLLLTLIFMLIFCSPIIINYSPNNLQIKKLNIFINDIYQCNLSLSQAVQDKSIDSNLAKDLLTTGIINLNNITREVSSLSVMKRNEVLKSTVMDTLSYNTSLYEITLSLLNTSDLNGINSNFPEYSNSLTLLEYSSNSLNLLGMNSPLPLESKVFFQNSSNYVTTILKITRDKNINTEQNKYFTLGLNECLSLLNNIDEDLKPALDKIKEDGRSLDILLSDLRNKRCELATIKNKSYSLTIPKDGYILYKELQDTLANYELYLTSLQYSLITESSNSSPSEIIKENYNESFEKYSSFTDNLKILKKSLDIFNKNCI